MNQTALPGGIQSHLQRVLPESSPAPRLVRITQTGEMVKKPGGRSLRFTAEQEISVHSVEFEWRAAFGPNRLVRVSVVDRYRNGEGLLAARVWGLVPVARSRGPDTDRGEVMRYLAELPWAPYAVRENRDLHWRELAETRIEVATVAGGNRVAVELGLDDSGLVHTASAIRPRREGGASVDRPWVGEYGDYVELGGVRVPASAEVRWELPEGPFTYWRGEVRSLETE